MELWNETQWYIPVVYNILLIVIPALAGIAILSESGALVITSLRKLWRTIRPLIDEPTDPAIIWLAQKTGKTEAQISEFILTEGDKIIALLPQEAVK